MSTSRRRIRTIQAIVAGCPAIGGAPIHTLIDTEFNEVHRARWVRIRDRRRLLQVLHSTRALDSSLKTFLNYHNCPQGNSLGGYLWSLTRHQSATLRTRLSGTARHHFQQEIVDKRNRYMHEAGSYPGNAAEVENLLSEMQDCIATVVAL